MSSQTYNDGVVKVYGIGDIAEAGDMPKEGLLLKESIRYKQRTVGMKRYYTALQANQRVDTMIRCPYRKQVNAQDIAILDGKQYRIELIQKPEEITPPVMDLTLSRLEQTYEL